MSSEPRVLGRALIDTGARLTAAAEEAFGLALARTPAESAPRWPP